MPSFRNQCLFCHIPMVKESHKANIDLDGREIDSTSCWGSVHITLQRGINSGTCISLETIIVIIYHTYTYTIYTTDCFSVFVKSQAQGLFKCSLESRDRVIMWKQCSEIYCGWITQLDLNVVSICVGYTPLIVISTLQQEA